MIKITSQKQALGLRGTIPELAIMRVLQFRLGLMLSNWL